MSFADTLLQTARSRSLEKSKFLGSLKRGDYSREALRIFVLRYANGAYGFLTFLAKLISICPDHRFRIHIINNLLEEEGLVYNPESGKMELGSGKYHVEMIQTFVRARGIPEEEFKNPAWKTGSVWLQKALKEGRWKEAAAFCLVGGEGNMPGFCRTMIPALKNNYGLSDDDLIFFREHICADEDHGRNAALLLEQATHTKEEKEIVLEAVRKGAQSFHLFFELCDREMRKKMAASASLSG